MDEPNVIEDKKEDCECDEKAKDTTTRLRKIIDLFLGKFVAMTPKAAIFYKVVFVLLLLMVFINVTLGPYYFAKMLMDTSSASLTKNPLNIESVDYATVQGTKIVLNSFDNFLKLLDPRNYTGRYNFLLFVGASFWIIVLSIALLFAHDPDKHIRMFAIIGIIYGVVCFGMNLSNYNRTAVTVVRVNDKYKVFNDTVKSYMLVTEGEFMRKLTITPRNPFQQEKLIQSALAAIKGQSQQAAANPATAATAATASASVGGIADIPVSAATDENAGANNNEGATANTVVEETALPPIFEGMEDAPNDNICMNATTMARALFSINIYKHYCNIGPSDDMRVEKALQVFDPSQFLMDFTMMAKIPNYTDFLFRRYANIHDDSSKYITSPVFQKCDKTVRDEALSICNAWTHQVSSLYSEFYPKDEFDKLRNMTAIIAVLQLIPLAAIAVLSKQMWIIKLVFGFMGIPLPPMP